MTTNQNCMTTENPSVLPASLRVWVQAAADRGLTPNQARTWLTSRGWPASVGDAAALEVERLSDHSSYPPPPIGPDRAHHHSFAYTMLFVAVGLSVLSLGSTIHLLLEWAFETETGSIAIANWVTVFVCTVPFAIAAQRIVDRIEREDPLSRFSQTRETLAEILLWVAGAVGGVRLLYFVHQLVSALVVERDISNLGWDVAHVTTVVLLAGSVFAWAWRFRFPDRPFRTSARCDV